MPTITQLEYLLAVDKHRHFGKAASERNVSQPSLSTQIQKLEDELGLVVFDRSKKPIVVTETGKDIIEQAKIVLKEHKRLSEIAVSGDTEPRGDFHLAIIPTLAPYLIPLFLNQFAEKYPRVNLKISESKTGDIIEDLIDDKIDAGLLVTPLSDQRIIERHLFFEPFYAYVSENHPYSKKKTLSEKELEEEGLWLLEEGHCFRDQVLKICSLDHKNTVLKNVEFSSGSLETLKNLVRRSSGYTLLPDLAVEEMSKNETDAHIRKFKKPVPTREVSLVHSRSFLREGVIAAMEETILGNLPRKIKSLKRQDIEIIDVY